MEELKLILQTLATMGESAKIGFIWWMVIDRLIPTLAWSSVVSGAIYGAYLFFRRRIDVEKSIEESNNSAEKAKADANAANSVAVVSILQIRRELGIQAYPLMKQDVSPYGLNVDHCAETVKAVVDLHRKGG